jgi:hypothetical protein
MSYNDIPFEYIHCINITDEIPNPDPMKVEEQRQSDLYEIVTLK